LLDDLFGLGFEGGPVYFARFVEEGGVYGDDGGFSRQIRIDETNLVAEVPKVDRFLYGALGEDEIVAGEGGGEFLQGDFEGFYILGRGGADFLLE
jgi:hypothetical protein